MRRDIENTMHSCVCCNFVYIKLLLCKMNDHCARFTRAGLFELFGCKLKHAIGFCCLVFMLETVNRVVIRANMVLLLGLS